MIARRATLAIVRAGALALLAACRGGSTDGIRIGVPDVNCAPSAPPMPVAHIGPDVAIRAICGITASAAVASVDERGDGVTSWSVSVQDPSPFFFNSNTFRTCQISGPSVATVFFAPPLNAMPGDTFEAVVTVHADDGSFADGTVNVHAVIVAPSIMVDKTTIDFGDVLPAAQVSQPIMFVEDGTQPLALLPSRLDPPFSLQLMSAMMGRPNAATWTVRFSSLVPGDFSASLVLSIASPVTSPGCQWSTTISLHARVSDDAGVPDGGADTGVDGAAR